MPNSEHGRRESILVSGATGYIGGRLIALLESKNITVRCLARNPEKLKLRVGSTTEIVRGDVLDAASLDQALSGIDTAYYLVHLMAGSQDFEKEDRLAASNFGQAAVK